MVRSYFAPDDFQVTPDRLQWAMATFKINKAEVERQTELWHEHEYKRAYGDWNRAWRRWFRQAERYGELRREREYTKPQELTPEQRRIDAEKAIAQMSEYRSRK